MVRDKTFISRLSLIASQLTSKRFRTIARYGVVDPVRWLAIEVKHAANRVRRSKNAEIRRIAVICDRGAWCSDQQLNPFEEYRDRLAEDFGLSFFNIYLDPIGRFPPISLRMFDVVMVKLSYRTPEAKAVELVEDIKRHAGDRPLIYMDGDDDVCVQWSAVISACDLYVKCHAFRNRADYKKQYLGKSNLHDYAINIHGHVLTPADYGRADQDPLIIPHTGPIPDREVAKIIVGWNMALADDIIPLWKLVRDKPPPEKKIDGAFRGSVKVETITGPMRAGVMSRMQNLSKRFNILVTAAHVSRADYHQELMDSRICVSPFGFGELCWRDFEAALCRAMLIKPDMSHIETSPDIFQPGVTYAPVKWDLSDLEDVCAYYLEHEDERRAIAERAFTVLDDYYRTFGFGEDLQRILARVLP